MAKAISLFKTTKIETTKPTKVKQTKTKSDNTNIKKRPTEKTKTIKADTVDKSNQNKPVKQKTKTDKLQHNAPNTQTKRRGRPPKNSLLPAEEKVIKTKPTKIQIEQSNKVSTPTSTSSGWINTNKTLPEELRPIEFNTSAKKPVYGYRLKGYGYVVTTPYYVDKFKKKYGYIEWKYIPYCGALFRCPNEIPDCSNCKHSKNRVK